MGAAHAGEASTGGNESEPFVQAQAGTAEEGEASCGAEPDGDRRVVHQVCVAEAHQAGEGADARARRTRTRIADPDMQKAAPKEHIEVHFGVEAWECGR